MKRVIPNLARLLYAGIDQREEDLKVRVYQNTAVATGRVTIKGQYSGQPTSGQYRSTHVWVKGQTGWQLVANQLTALAAK